MEILQSAHRHGLSGNEIGHAWNNALGFYDIEPDREPPKSLCIGPDTAGNLIEVLYLRLLDEDVIIHAMPLRKHFERYLIGPGR